MSKHPVHLIQVNSTFGRSAFLPYSVALLQAYAQTDEVIRKNFDFQPFVFLREPIADVVGRMHDPAVVGISLYIWNHRYSVALGKAIKEAFPSCLMVLGGPHVPNRSENFFKEHPWADVLIHGEGEEAFREVLLARVQGGDYLDVPGLSVNLGDGLSKKTAKRERIADIDKYPSPYLVGLFDDLMKGGTYDFQATQETHRGCPFQCLAGDTLVNTVHGKIPIKELADKGEPIGVFTYDLETKTAKVSTATSPRLTGTDKTLVRVTFSDGSYVDCTPDHRFLVFKWGNQFTDERQWASEAKNLQPGQSVRAIREELAGPKISKSLRGLKRSAESKERYRLAATRREAAKKTARLTGQQDEPPVNHKVVSVETIPGLHDVYCMEVPETGWFYANDVLVKNCTFCDWGSSVFTKVRKFGDDRLMHELDWFAEHKVDLLYNADANYAMYERDVSLTKYMAGLKRQFGYPNKFRAAYAKNSGDRVYQVSKILNDAGMCKGVTLSFQSMDEGTLTAVKRKNIGVEVFKGLMMKYREEGIPTYSELIIGLPGESYATFADGLEKLLDCGQHDSVNVYTCEVLPNSELNDPAYRERYGITSAVTPQIFYHATPSDDPYREEYEIVTGTNTLPPEDWLKCELLACFVQGFHCLGLTQVIAIGLKAKYGIGYRRFYEALIEHAASDHEGPLGKLYLHMRWFYQQMRDGRTPELVDGRFGNISWPPEEYLFLRCIIKKDKVYSDLWGWSLEEFSEVADDYLWHLFRYQEAAVKAPSDPDLGHRTYKYDIPEIIRLGAVGRECNLEPGNYVYRFEPTQNYADNAQYAKEQVWFGRKGGMMLRKAILATEVMS